MAGVMKASGAKTSYQVAKLFDATLEKRFEKYACGSVSPTNTTLSLVEKKFPGTRRVYEKGPGKRVSLWDAMDGAVEHAWGCLVSYDPIFDLMRRRGAGQDARARVLAEKLNIKPVQPDYIEYGKGLQRNAIAAQINESEELKESIGFDELAAVAALWRFSQFVGWCPSIDYLYDGVCRSNVLSDLFEDWKINPKEFIDFMKRHQAEF